MTETILVWLLIGLPWSGSSSTNKPATLVAKFATVEECTRVREVIDTTSVTRCVQANIVKEWK